VLAVAAAASLLYAPVAAGIVRQWIADPASSHGVLLVAAAAFVLRRRWTLLRDTPTHPSNAGFALLLLSLLLYATGTLAGELFVLRTSALLSLSAVILTLCGRTHLRLLTAPLALLLLAIPIPALIVTSLTLPLQLVASDIAARLLTAVAIPTVRDGNLLTLGNVTLEVAEACSGLRSIVSLVSMVALVKAVGGLRAGEAVALAVATIPVAIVGNGLRVAATGVLTHWFGVGMARGLPHEATGVVAFAAMCGVLVVLHRFVISRFTGRTTSKDTCDSPALAW
jgi:exosortase